MKPILGDNGLEILSQFRQSFEERNKKKTSLVVSPVVSIPSPSIPSPSTVSKSGTDKALPKERQSFFETTKKQIQMFDYLSQSIELVTEKCGLLPLSGSDFWNSVSNRMKSRGFDLSGDECKLIQNKYVNQI